MLSVICWARHYNSYWLLGEFRHCLLLVAKNWRLSVIMHIYWQDDRKSLLRCGRMCKITIHHTARVIIGLVVFTRWRLNWQNNFLELVPYFHDYLSKRPNFHFVFTCRMLLLIIRRIVDIYHLELMETWTSLSSRIFRLFRVWRTTFKNSSDICDISRWLVFVQCLRKVCTLVPSSERPNVHLSIFLLVF